MHKHGVYHRDIKPQNILLNSDLELKIADFGLSKNIADMKGSSTTSTRIGSQSYWPPELHETKGSDKYETKEPYEPAKFDIFAAGTLLFLMLTGKNPFIKATAADPYYNLIIQGKSDTFWSIYDRRLSLEPDILNMNFKNLINAILNPNPALRPDADKILESDWL